MKIEQLLSKGAKFFFRRTPLLLALRDSEMPCTPRRRALHLLT